MRSLAGQRKEEPDSKRLILRMSKIDFVVAAMAEAKDGDEGR
jgi:hypothetical protein